MRPRKGSSRPIVVPRVSFGQERGRGKEGEMRNRRISNLHTGIVEIYVHGYIQPDRPSFRELTRGGFPPGAGRPPPRAVVRGARRCRWLPPKGRRRRNREWFIAANVARNPRKDRRRRRSVTSCVCGQMRVFGWRNDYLHIYIVPTKRTARPP